MFGNPESDNLTILGRKKMSKKRGLTNGVYSEKFKQAIVDVYLSEKITYLALAERFGVSFCLVRTTIKRYERGEPLVKNNRPRHSAALKRKILSDYKKKPQKYTELAKKFNVSPSLVRTLVNNYENGVPVAGKKIKQNPKVKLPERTAAETQANQDRLEAAYYGAINFNEYVCG